MKPKHSRAFPAPPCSVERTTRSVIERKLLTALGDESKVVILATNEDLELLAIACEFLNEEGSLEMARGLRQLQREAFPPNVRTHRRRANDACIETAAHSRRSVQ